MTANNPPLSPFRQWLRRRPVDVRDDQLTTTVRRSAHPLHEALAIGLGSETLDHKMTKPPAWR